MHCATSYSSQCELGCTGVTGSKVLGASTWPAACWSHTWGSQAAEHPRLHGPRLRSHIRAANAGFIPMLALNSALAFFVNLTNFLVTKTTSALTLQASSIA